MHLHGSYALPRPFGLPTAGMLLRRPDAYSSLRSSVLLMILERTGLTRRTVVLRTMIHVAGLRSTRGSVISC